jgi:DNA-binding beta-propeller fold protein YncE
MPAGNRPAERADSGTSILPGGRYITPLGEQFFTGPGPFGLAVSPSGQFVVSADGGPNRYALTVLDNRAIDRASPAIKHLYTARKRSRGEDADDADDAGDDPEWLSVFMGLAFDGEHTLYASEGESGKVRAIDIVTGKRQAVFDLNQGGYRDSYTGHVAIDTARGLLFVVDQANFRLVEIDSRRKAILQSIRTGRLPFAVALAPDGRTAYVTDLGMFEYRALPGADPKDLKATGLPFPAFGFPSKEAVHGARRQTESGLVKVPGLGEPNARGSNGVTMIDVADPKALRVIAQSPTGLPFGGSVFGGSSPSGVVVAAGKVYVSNANQDTLSVFDASTRRREPDIALRIPGYENLRGVLPIGMAATADAKWLLVAEAGINAIGVIDIATGKLIGDRHRGGGHPPTPATPPCVRVRTRRFGSVTLTILEQ